MRNILERHQARMGEETMTAGRVCMALCKLILGNRVHVHMLYVYCIFVLCSELTGGFVRLDCLLEVEWNGFYVLIFQITNFF